MPHFVCVFEDKKFSNFFPLSLSQPTFELRIGFQNLRLRLQEELSGSPRGVLCRDYLSRIMQLRDPELKVNDIPEGEVLFLNGRLLCFGDELKTLIQKLPVNAIGVKGGYVVAARMEGETSSDFAGYIRKRISEEAISRLCEELRRYLQEGPARSPSAPRKKLIVPEEPDEGTFEDDHELGQDNLLEKLPQELTNIIEKWRIEIVDMFDARLLSFPWQIIEENAKAMEDDFQKFPFRGQAEESIVYGGVQMVGEENIVIGEAAVIKPGVVLDASAGPIVIGDGTMVMPNVSLIGPVYVGKQSIVKTGAKILEGTSIGDVCKVGGEVDSCILASYTNKQHDGFLGHSYIGEWVNIGAGSNNSDLKNNYSPVRLWCAGVLRETGRQFLGLVIADHTKTGINTMFNTGTVVGVMSNVFGPGYPPKFIPSFTWGGSEGFVQHDPEKALETARRVMARRKVQMSPAYERLFRHIFQMTQSERNQILKKYSVKNSLD